MIAAALPLKILIRVYQLIISPWLPPSCRYYPSCSQYSLEALEKHGLLIGSAYSIWRILRCQPWGGEGFNPVPEKPFIKLRTIVNHLNTWSGH